jgi:hypothetical protein
VSKAGLIGNIELRESCSGLEWCDEHADGFERRAHLNSGWYRKRWRMTALGSSQSSPGAPGEQGRELRRHGLTLSIERSRMVVRLGRNRLSWPVPNMSSAAWSSLHLQGCSC